MAVLNRTSWQYVGSAALTGGEILKWSAANQVDVATSNADKLVGVAAEACAAGNTTAQNITVTPLIPGTTVQVIGAGTLSAGTMVMVTTGGKVTTATAKTGTQASALQFVLGFLNEASGSSGTDVVEMLVIGGVDIG